MNNWSICGWESLLIWFSYRTSPFVQLRWQQQCAFVCLGVCAGVSRCLILHGKLIAFSLTWSFQRGSVSGTVLDSLHRLSTFILTTTLGLGLAPFQRQEPWAPAGKGSRCSSAPTSWLLAGISEMSSLHTLLSEFCSSMRPLHYYFPD